MRQQLLLWLPFVVITTVLSGLIYVIAQQNMRMAANDPQIQLSEDMAQRLAADQTVSSVLPTESVEVAQSLAPYVIVFNEAGQRIATNATVDGQFPTLPMGIFTYTKVHLQDRLTWQPRDGVRSALVVTRFSASNSSGFVAVGRSLREVELREAQLLLFVGLAWVAAVGGAFVTIATMLALTPVRHSHSALSTSA